MANRSEKRAACQICKAQKSVRTLVPAELVRETIVETIRRSHPDWSPSGYICSDDLRRFRAQYIEEALEQEKGELSALEAEVVESLRQQEMLSQNVNVEFERLRTLGERLADRVAEFGGSWPFIICFGGALVFWIGLNSYVLSTRPFDPYPFIFLNLLLSCLAAIQAPVIMMSQKRQESKDRLRAEHDYRVNLKAELEVRHLNAKLDELMTQQWHRLLEIQEIQLETMNELTQRRTAGPGKPG
ncbi:MAG TPA: DUF1003 domain-containing protein [Phycisphaerae bacterium]|nr:DUF1003 domain-containing protein [Phycisphaerae bacterium]